MSVRPKNTLTSLAPHVLAIAASLVTTIPVYLVCVNALKSEAQSSSMGVDLPTELHFENFATVIDRGKLTISFLNSMLYSTGAAILATLFAALAAFILSRHRTRLNRALYFFLIMGIALPINFFTLTKMMQVTHLINTKPGMIILYATLQVPFAVFLMYGFVASIPRELDEAAAIDGCGPLEMFFRVILPLLMPVLVTTFILSFLNTWNDFIMPLYYLNSSENWPMTLAVYNFFGQFKQSWNLVSADILLTIVPVLLVYLAGQRFILSGMTSGAVKG
ncbi:carbohydrate ABC transporter permease [Devosia sp.]|uniref:carbohydrate ABC transporter permease n=1 Tax=Devosia sp. TaxID=1871048 RepID=UPI00326742BC